VPRTPEVLPSPASPLSWIFDFAFSLFAIPRAFGRFCFSFLSSQQLAFRSLRCRNFRGGYKGVTNGFGTQHLLSTFVPWATTHPTALRHTVSTNFASVFVFWHLLGWYTRDGRNLLFSLRSRSASPAGRAGENKKSRLALFPAGTRHGTRGRETGLDSTTGWRDLLPRSIRCRTSHLSPYG
jgi:hypothetical protein